MICSHYREMNPNDTAMQNTKLKSKCCSAIAFLLIGLSGCTTAPKLGGKEEVPAPDDQYHYYSGNKNAGNFYCKQQNFIHPETQKTVALIGMIHIADVGFYHQIQSICDSADLVLAEGVSGRGNLNFTTLFLTYALAAGDRTCGAMRCVSQGDVLDESGENWKNADLSFGEITADGSIPKDLLMGALLPFVVVVVEPWNLVVQTQHGIATGIGKEKAQVAGLRHRVFTLEPMKKDASEDKEDDTDPYKLIPGLIEGRNAHLMAVFDEEIKREDCDTVAIPWGAAHNPDLEKQLLERGFRKSDATWHRAVAVKDLLEGEAVPKGSRKFYFPYVLSVNRYDDVSRWSALFNLVSCRSNTYGKSFELGYGHLFKWGKSENKTSIALLPQFFGRPLLFDYRNGTNSDARDAGTKDQKKWRFLLFFSL